MSNSRVRVHAVLAAFVASLMSILVAFSPASADPCTDYGVHLRWLGGTITDDDCLSVAPGDGYAYVSDGDFGMRVIDLDPPDRAEIVATLPTAEYARAVDALGSLAVVADWSTFTLVDVSTPTLPNAIATFPAQFQALTAAFDPRTEVLGGSAEEPDLLYLLEVGPGYGFAGVRLIDVTEPRNPQQIEAVSSWDSAAGLDYVEQTVNLVRRSYLYLALGYSGVQIIDVTDPHAAAETAVYATSNSARAATAKDGVAYVAVASAGVEIVDVSDPAAPTWITTLDTPEEALDVTLLGSNLLVADNRGGVHVVDVRDPEQPTIRRTIYTPFRAYQVRVAGDRLYVADRHRGIHVFDVTTLEPVPPIATVDTPGDATKIRLSGDHAFVADGAGGLQVFDIANPDAPSLVGSLPPRSGDQYHEFRDLEIVGSTAYIAGYYDGFHIVDISDPTQPAYLSTTTWGVSRFVIAVDVVGDLAYALVNLEGVHILDVSDPLVPQSVGFFPYVASPYDVTVRNDVLYLASNSGLWTVNISDPALPLLLGQLAGGYRAMRPAANDLAYVVSLWDREVRVLDLADPYWPVIVGRVEAGVSPVELHLDGDVLYAASVRMGVHALDISDPLNPVDFANVQPVGEFPINDGMEDLRVAGGRLLVATGEAGLVVLPEPCTAAQVDAPVVAGVAPELAVTAEPNPFFSRTDVRFTLVRDTLAGVDVFDVHGRRVRGLLTKPLDSGPHVVSWDGRDGAGRPAAAGVYFVRVSVAGETRSVKLVRVR